MSNALAGAASIRQGGRGESGQDESGHHGFGTSERRRRDRRAPLPPRPERAGSYRGLRSVEFVGLNRPHGRAFRSREPSWQLLARTARARRSSSSTGTGTTGDLWRERARRPGRRPPRSSPYNRARLSAGSPGPGATHWRDHGRRRGSADRGGSTSRPAAGRSATAPAAIPALDLALRRPELVSSLVLLDPAVHARDEHDAGARCARSSRLKLLDRLGRRETRGSASWFKFVTSYSTGGCTWDKTPEERKRAGSSANGRRHARRSRRCATTATWPTTGSAGIEAPVTIIECELRPVVPAARAAERSPRRCRRPDGRDARRRRRTWRSPTTRDELERRRLRQATSRVPAA